MTSSWRARASTPTLFAAVSPCSKLRDPTRTVKSFQIPPGQTGNTEVGCFFGIRTDKRPCTKRRRFRRRTKVKGAFAKSSICDRIAFA